MTLSSFLLVIILFTSCNKLGKEGSATATVSITVRHSQSSSRMAGKSRSFTANADTELIALVTDNTPFNQQYLSLDNRYQFALTDLSTDIVSLTVPLDTGIKLYSYGYFDDIFTLSELENTATLAEQFGETSSFTIRSGDTSKEVNLTIIDTTAPTVTSVSNTADNQSLVSITDNISVTFSETMDTTYVTTNTSNTNCAGTISVSSDNFSTCVRMSSEPIGSNSNKTFILDPSDNLTMGLTFLTRVTTGVKDTAGNALSSQYDNSIGFTTSEDISISSSASDNATVDFGQSYQYQLTNSGTYSGTITYSLSNQPDNMTISSSGLVEWTPTKASEITTHSAVVITLTTASGFVLTEAYDLTVTGTCVTGNVLSIWSGDQRSSTDSSNLLGNITAYTDNSSSVKTASANYNYSSSSINLTHGPAASATKGNIFFYNQYNNTDNLYLFWMFGVNGSSVENNVHLDVYTAKNESSDNLVISDDSGETNRESQSTTESLYSSTYTGRYKYISCCSDGGVIGPFSGSSFRVFVDLTGTSLLTATHSTTSAEDLAASGVSGYDLGTGNLDSFTYWSKDGSSFSLGDTDNFTVGYNTTLDCSN